MSEAQTFLPPQEIQKEPNWITELNTEIDRFHNSFELNNKEVLETQLQAISEIIFAPERQDDLRRFFVHNIAESLNLPEEQKTKSEEKLFNIFNDPGNEGKYLRGLVNKALPECSSRYDDRTYDYLFEKDISNGMDYGADLVYTHTIDKKRYSFGGYFGNDISTTNFIETAYKYLNINDVNIKSFKKDILLYKQNFTNGYFNKDNSTDTINGLINYNDPETTIPIILNIMESSDRGVNRVAFCDFYKYLCKILDTNPEIIDNLKLNQKTRNLIDFIKQKDNTITVFALEGSVLSEVCIEAILNQKNIEELSHLLKSTLLSGKEKYLYSHIIRKKKVSELGVTLQGEDLSFENGNAYPNAKYFDKYKKIIFYDYDRNGLDFKKIINLMNDETDKKYYLLINELRENHRKEIGDYVLKVPKKTLLSCFDVKNNFYIPNTNFFKTFASEEVGIIDFINSKEYLKNVYGDEVGEKFLKSLPNNAVERRNAFTRNEYDRTSKYLKYVVEIGKKYFSLDAANLSILSDFISEYGFCESQLILETYFAIKQNKIKNIPKYIASCGVKTTEALKIQYDQAVSRCTSLETIDKKTANSLNALQLELISSATGNNNGRWRRHEIDQIVQYLPDKESEFQTGHFAASISIDTLKFNDQIQFDPNETNSYKRAITEILSAAKNPEDITDIAKQLTQVINNLKDQKPNLENMPEEKRQKYLEFFQKTKEKNNEFYAKTLEQLQQANDIDGVLKAILPSFRQDLGSFSKEIESLTRTLFFKKILQRQLNSSNFVEQVIATLDNHEDKITIETVQTIRNIYSNYLKDHVLSDNHQDEKYWSDEMYSAIKSINKLNQKLEIGDTITKLNNLDHKIRQEAQGDNQIKIQSIPDRGLIGELSGYIGDACYTQQFPLLAKRDNLIPYKFVVKTEGQIPEIVGSCLIFEEKDAEGNPVLLIRALNLPKYENKINIGQFIERFFDQIAEVAKNRNIKKVLIAPTSGTISNFSGVSNYVIENYVRDKKPEKLANRFDFNYHDITNSCCVVREPNLTP